MDENSLNDYIKNMNTISSLLNQNEMILKKAGYNPPVTDFFVNKKDRIKMPTGYIRTSNEFCQKYHLYEIVKSQETRKNISYALQLSDYYIFLINRFYVWGSIEAMLYKQAFVNLLSIIEAIILESANNINEYCNKCKNIGKCANNISKKERSTMKTALKKLSSLGILEFETDEKERLLELYDLRNKIHIRLNPQNEFLDNKYNMELYNETIGYLKRVDEFLWKNGTIYYNSCIGYVIKNNRTI